MVKKSGRDSGHAACPDRGRAPTSRPSTSRLSARVAEIRAQVRDAARGLTPLGCQESPAFRDLRRRLQEDGEGIRSLPGGAA